MRLLFLKKIKGSLVYIFFLHQSSLCTGSLFSCSTSGRCDQKLLRNFSDIAYLIHHIIPLKAESVAVLDVFFNVKLILFVIIG